MWLLEFTVRVMMVVSLALMALFCLVGIAVAWILNKLFSGGRGRRCWFIAQVPLSSQQYLRLQDFGDGSSLNLYFRR